MKELSNFNNIYNQAGLSDGLESVGSVSRSSQLFALLWALALISMLTMFCDATTSWMTLIICLRTNIGVDRNSRSHHAPNPNIGRAMIVFAIKNSLLLKMVTWSVMEIQQIQ